MTLDEQDLIDMVSSDIHAISNMLFAISQQNITEKEHKEIEEFLSNELYRLSKIIKKINA